MTWDENSTLLILKIAAACLLTAAGYCLDQWLRARKAKRERIKNERFWNEYHASLEGQGSGSAVRCPVQDGGP